MPGEYAPITTDARWRIGEDKYLWFLLLEDGIVPTDLATAGAWNFEWELRERADDPDSILKLTTAGGGISVQDHAREDTGVVAKHVRVFVPRASSLTLDPGVYWHSLRRTDTGKSAVVAEGPCEILFAATR